MMKQFLLIILLALAVFLAGCAQSPPEPPGTSGLEQDSQDLESSVAASETELDNGLNEIPVVEPINPQDLQVSAQQSGLEAEEVQLSKENSTSDSLSPELSDFTDIDALTAIDPADMQ